MHSLLDDLSVLTTIARYNLDELLNKSISIISHDVEESLRNRESVVAVDVGIGQLIITNIENELFYKFIPSRRLDDAVKSTYENRKSELAIDIDKSLGQRITKTYKDLF